MSKSQNSSKFVSLYIFFYMFLYCQNDTNLALSPCVRNNNTKLQFLKNLFEIFDLTILTSNICDIQNITLTYNHSFSHTYNSSCLNIRIRMYIKQTKKYVGLYSSVLFILSIYISRCTFCTRSFALFLFSDSLCKNGQDFFDIQ